MIQNSTAPQHIFAKDALELIKAMQSLIPNYEERRRDGHEGYYEGTRLQELHMVKSWLNGICIFLSLDFILFFHFVNSFIFLYICFKKNSSLNVLFIFKFPFIFICLLFINIYVLFMYYLFIIYLCIN